MCSATSSILTTITQATLEDRCRLLEHLLYKTKIELHGEDVKDVNVIWVTHPIATGHRIHVYNKHNIRQILQVTQIVHVTGGHEETSVYAWVKEVPE